MLFKHFFIQNIYISKLIIYTLVTFQLFLILDYFKLLSHNDQLPSI
jgi:hypothetical protein